MTNAIRRLAAVEAAVSALRLSAHSGSDDEIERLAEAIRRIDDELRAERGELWWLNGPPHYCFYRFCDIYAVPPDR